MRSALILILLILITGVFEAQASETPVALSSEDTLIYEATVKKCRPGTVTSALSIAFDKNNFINGLANWLQLASGDLLSSEARIKSGGMSPSVALVRRSPGFWLAMSECYGYQYGELNYGNLIKQIIDMGHLTTESTSTLAGLAITTGGSKLTTEAMKRFPLVSRFFIASLISLHVATTVNLLASVYFPEMNPQDIEHLNRIKAQAFKEPDAAIANVNQQAQAALEKIDQRLDAPFLSEEERTQLLTKRNLISENLQNLRRLKASY